MPVRFGWFSTGRDEAARKLLQVVWEKIETGLIPGGISFVFCNRERGEAEQSDLFLDFIEKLGLPVITFSSHAFRADLRQRNREGWRSAYHQEVMGRIASYAHDLIVLAGYMLIVSPEMCRYHSMINLHPALPTGPTGTWEEVIDELIRNKAPTTGAMMHLVTEKLDRGPVVAYYEFPIQGGGFTKLWHENPSGRGELFWRIRQEGARKEIPLIVLTLKALAEGTIRIQGEKVLDSRGQEIKGVSLTHEVEAYLKA